MGTIGSSLSSAANPASTPVTSSGTSSIFTGTSAYSKDFQNVISRAVAIANLPVSLLTSQQTALSSQSNELNSLDTKFTALQTAIQGIQHALSGSSFQAAVSQPAAVDASLSDGATEGVYSIQVDSVGSFATSLTATAWDATPAAPTTYSLLIGDGKYSITPSDNSAATVAATINSQYGNLVHATAVDVGTSAHHDYRVSLQSTTLGPMALDIQRVVESGLQQQTTPTSDGFATSQTANTWDTTGQPSSYNLAIGDKYYTFAASDDSAATVVDAINNNPQLSTLVTASLADLDPAGVHDYRILLESKTPGAMSLDLQKVTGFQQPQTTGELTRYAVDGAAAVTSATRSATVSSGVTLNLLATTAIPVDVTVTRSSSALSTALSSFADAYNAASGELSSQRGQSAGALQGQSILSSLSRALSSIGTYDAQDGSVGSLASLGLDLGADGHLKFSSLVLLGADFSNSVGVTSFLGSSTGGGFLSAATAVLDGLQDSARGLLKTTEADLKTQITDLGKQISDKQNKVSALQIQLQNQMAQSDALIASMEQQYSYMSSMFSAQDTADKAYGK